jgi:hypothetical protein
MTEVIKKKTRRRRRKSTSVVGYFCVIEGRAYPMSSEDWAEAWRLRLLRVIDPDKPNVAQPARGLTAVLLGNTFEFFHLGPRIRSSLAGK